MIVYVKLQIVFWKNMEKPLYMKRKKHSLKDEFHPEDEELKKEEIYISRRELIEYGLIFAVVFIVMNFVISIGHIKSASMEPTLMTGDICVGNRLAYVVREPKCGDIIIFKYNNQIYGKRVIGVAGDEVSFSDGYVYINGERLNESAYLDDDVKTYSIDTFEVPEDCVFVLGDYRERSNDSRYWTEPYVPCDDIIGKVVFKIPTGQLFYKNDTRE